MKSSAHVVVSGMVQGVGFRYFVYQHATQLAITGWVKNLPNGDVELEVEGSRESLENLIAHLRLGPRFAYVTNAEVSWTQHRGRFNRFEIR